MVAKNIDQTADRVKFSKEEDIKPLIITFRKIFEPMTKAMKDIALIPKEVTRIVDVIRKDIKSGKPDRFVSGSEKSADSVDMIQMMKDYMENTSEEGKKRQQDLADLERIAQERAKTEAEVQQLQQLGTPAVIGEDNKVKLLNEKEIIEKQKEYIKEQKEVTKIEKLITEEQEMGGDADADKLIMLKNALDKQNELVEENTKILGNRLPRQKVPQTVGVRDFIPGPLMEAYDNIKDSAMESGRALGSIIQPFIGFKKKFLDKQEYEDEFLEDKKKKDKKMGLAMVMTTLKFVALTAALVVFAKTVFDLAKKFGVDLGNPNLSRKRGLLTQENDEEYKQRLIDEEGLSNEDAGKRVRGDYGNLNKLFGLGMHDDPEQELAEDINTDFQNTRRSQMINDRENFKIEKNDNFMNKRRNEMTRDRDKFLEKPTVDDSQNENKNSQVAIGNVDYSTNNKILNAPTEIKADESYRVIG